jgi:tetratricopeptide (TPR) repeat protein
MRIVVLAGILGLAAPALADIAFPREQQPPPPLRAATLTAPAPPTGPSIDFTSVVKVVEPVRREQEQILAALIQDTPDSQVEEKADYYFRLATLYTSLQLTATKPEQQKMYLLKAVKAYKGLTDNDAFRNYARMDRALFTYGYTLQSGRYMKEARAVYDKLLKNYPNSVYVPTAHLAFAEYFFDQHMLADAEARYKQVLTFPKSDVYAYALYKLGRIDFELQRYQDALETYFEVVRLTPMPQLRDAAEVGFVAAYTQVGKPAQAHNAFMRVDPAHAAAMDALYAPGVCTTRVDTADKLEALAALGPQCKDDAVAMANELARAWHNDYATNHNLDTLVAAERAYKLALSVTPDAELQAGYAEALWSHAVAAPSPERWAAAATAFAATDVSASVLAWKNALGPAPADKPDVATAARSHVRTRRLSALQEQALTALEKAPLEDPDELVDTRLFIAAHYRATGHPERAIGPLADIVDQFPQHEKAELAASLVLDSMLRAHKAGDARVYAGDLAADAELIADKPLLQHDIARVLRRR